MANTATEIDWDSPVTKKHIKEAAAVGLKMLGAGRNRQYRTYRFDICGHKREIKTGDVRANSFRCDLCLQEKHRKEAKAVGLTLIGVGRNSFYRSYRFNKCEHEQDIQVGDVRINNFRCGQCLKDKLNEEAKAVGLILIGTGRNKDNRTYRFNKCEHEQEIETGNVRANSFRCDLCLQEKHHKEAKAVGLTLLGAGRNKATRTYRFNNCSHKQVIETGKVRTNQFICNTCEETARDLPSKVYLLKITVDTVIRSFTWLKLGYAKTVNTRIKYYGLPSDAVIERLKVMDFKTGRQAHRYEASLHTKYKRKRLPIKKMKEFFSYSGYNECYPLEMLDTLMKDLEAKEKRMKKQQEKTI